MKVAIYIESGLTQLVLTPEGKFEETALAAMTSLPQNIQIKKGGFYECHGGWFRQEAEPVSSVMLIVDMRTPQ